MGWIVAATLSLLSFGFWGFFTKFSVLYIDSKSALIFQTFGVVIVALLLLMTMNFKTATDTKGIFYAILTGITYGLGCWFYFIAATKGKITTVVTFTALYPVITILLAYVLLREAISVKQFLGIVLALAAIYLLAG